MYNVHCVSEKRPSMSLYMSLLSINRFSKFFHWHTL